MSSNYIKTNTIICNNIEPTSSNLDININTGWHKVIINNDLSVNGNINNYQIICGLGKICLVFKYDLSVEPLNSSDYKIYDCYIFGIYCHSENLLNCSINSFALNAENSSFSNMEVGIKYIYINNKYYQPITYYGISTSADLISRVLDINYPAVCGNIKYIGVQGVVSDNQIHVMDYNNVADLYALPTDSVDSNILPGAYCSMYIIRNSAGDKYRISSGNNIGIQISNLLLKKNNNL
jgi:hypothetical protein